jgi:hypothetical protein
MRLRPTTVVFGVSLALLVALGCLAANAQSGRRQAKPAASAPVPTPTPEPSPSPTPKRNENDVNFLVAHGDRSVNWSGLPYTFYEAARNGCADRLRDKTSYAVDVSQREMNRSEAIQKAKASKTTYVVLINLIEDRMAGSSSSGYTPLEVEYVVFAPGTAKVVANGRSYESSARKGPISVGRPPGSNLPSYREGMLRRAGEDAADRILKSLHLSDPPKTNTTETAAY